MSKFIAVIVEGTLSIHARDTTGNYATLCGLDGDDPHPGAQQSMAKVPRGRKIDCTACRNIWQVAKQYRATDFEQK